MRHITLLFSFLFCLFLNGIAQQTRNNETPKLVVGIVVDQMRYDYLFRYWNKYGEGGFKRMLREGFNCENTQYNYVPTYTGPGHASIFTGTTPIMHGIISNDWYDRALKAEKYCAADPTMTTIGGSSEAGKKSPKNLLASGIGDELRLSTNFQAKVVGVAMKDRSAIFPAGHTANGAYWYDAATGNFVTSSFYMKDLPEWAKKFNAQELAKKYLAQPWNTFFPVEQYTESIEDNNKYEGKYSGESSTSFPHNLPEIAKTDGLGLIFYTPWGNTLTKDMAIAAIKGEDLGKDAVTDMLTISFSCTDIVGHKFGPTSIEVEDTYIRLDRDLADFFAFLDGNIGKGKYLTFLTADHGAVHVAQYLKDNKIPAGRFSDEATKHKLNIYTANKYQDSLIASVSNQQVYFDLEKLAKKNVNKKEISIEISEYLLGFEGVANSFISETFRTSHFENKPFSLIQNGFNAKRSGDVIFHYEPSWIDFGETGTSHGTAYSYDTRVPLLWMGWHIQKGTCADEINITDIAPTLSILLNTSFPNACTGKPIVKVLEKQ